MALKKRMLAASVAVAVLAAWPAAHAKTLRWSSQGDVTSWDIHSQNNALNNGIHAMVYESLTYYNSETFEVEPMLAVSWEELSPTQVRFKLREGVKFSDGTPFTADDAVFSIERAMAPTSNLAVFANSIERAEKVDEHTMDLHLKAVNPILTRQLTELRMMSKAWAEKNNSVAPKDMKGADENFAHRNALGTGPYVLESWQPDTRMVLKRNPNWWGKMPGNVTEIIYQPIGSAATRMAALLSGEVDFVLDPTPQDLPRLRKTPNLKVVDGIENRTIFFGMDQHRDELPGSNIKGKNPLKDVKVRQALYQAIDINTIIKNSLRGLGQPAGTLVAPMVNGYTKELDQRLPYDVAAAKKLLEEAGYPNGFEVDFACPNNRYIGDEAICQAVTAMWARIGVKAKLRTQPTATYFPMIQRHEASIYMLGWGVPPFDAMYSLQSLVRTKTSGADGNYNVGRYSNSEADRLIDAAKEEGDPAKRTELLSQALKVSNDTVSHLPLHNQIIPWVMKKNISVVHRADNRLDMRRVVVE
ncbi:ABC transporter substrate-binding protein [Vandammella animalimorsus]|uniref:ABC transporter substrate-binding protein n=1 Tax=Vandammella animalimorsus TaxID=2029117 RepID=A0A3M6RRD8_9BURK|nr:ABC transporter substrate-binding protein [Vandammella animalimorsus]RMX17628.1 ABC transporter substrate-binding protein [Vandammella animalimorsus]